MITIRRFVGMPLALMLTGAVAAVAAAADSKLALVQRYADAMLEHGRDHHGAVSSPLFASALDRASLSLLTNQPASPEGIRDGNRTLSGANPMHDENFLRVLYLLSDLTGEPRYAKGADDALRFFFRHCQSEVSGLMACGEHLGWDFRTDSVIAGRDKHEFYRPWVLWNRSWALAPEACRRFALAHPGTARAAGGIAAHDELRTGEVVLAR